MTDNLVNWEDVELAFKREDYDGVIRSFSTKFEFSNAAYSLLVDEYMKNYLNSSASIVYYTRNNSWLWNEVFRCSLDYSTFTYNGTTCEINAVDNSLASLIKAKRGTQYEYAVSGIKEEYPLQYDHLVMENSASWIITGTEESNEGGDYIKNEFKSLVGTRYFHFPLYIENSEIFVKNRIETYDVEKSAHGSLDDITYSTPLFTNISLKTITVNITIDFQMIDTVKVEGEGDTEPFLDVVSILPGENEGDQNSYQVIKTFNLGPSIHSINHVFQDYELRPGESIAINFRIQQYDSSMTINTYELYFFNYVTNRLSIDFKERENKNNIDIVNPITLLNRLLKSMNGGKDGITGTIAKGVDSRLDETFLMAAESARGLDNAKMYSSYTKFCNWMSAEFGFVPVIDDSAKSVSFVHRSTLFRDVLIKDMGDDVTEFQYEVDESLIYSRLRVGYEKVDYDSVNGRDEWRFTTEYTTGVTLTDNSLELISPYRADAYGIEFLAAKRGEETTDDESDTDLFMVGAYQPQTSGGNLPAYATWYELIRGDDYFLANVISPETMFNAMYSQRYMIEANKRYIAVSANILEYASSDGNSEVVVGGVRVDSDVKVSNGLFTVGKLSFNTGDLEKPSDLSGYLSVENNGRKYMGYIQSASYSYGREKEVKYELIVKEVE